jgi:PTH1 family peptidyl-tRNA hydrolase
MLAEKMSLLRSCTWQAKFKGSYAQTRLQEGKIIFLKPETYMNQCGRSVRACADFFKIDPESMLIVHDDAELDFGRAELKKNGGLAGHNGLRSIASELGTRDFYRFRLGISHPRRGDLQSHVLGPFSREEQISLPSYLTKSSALLESILVTRTAFLPNDSPKRQLKE